MFCKVLVSFTAISSVFAGSDCIQPVPLPPAKPYAFKERSLKSGPIEASFLLWQSKMGGLEFASKSFLPSEPTATNQTFQEKLYVPDFAWKPGFKINAGYNLLYDGWDLNGCYTFYHGQLTSLKKHFDSQIAPTGIGIVPLWHYPFIEMASSPTPLRFKNAAANWKLFFNSFDLALGREFLPLNSLPIKVHLGAKAGWIHQYYHVDYANSNTFSGLISPPTAVDLQYLESTMVFSNHFWGLGPRAGVTSNWVMGAGLSLIADAALSLLASFTNVTTKYDDTLLNLSSGSPFKNTLELKEKIKELTPVLEARLGLDWEGCFSNPSRELFIGISIGYEVQYWWAQNHTRRNYPYEAPGNMWDSREALQMHGLTATFHWDY